jgi:mono/diheme cytochrome c family protein
MRDARLLPVVVALSVACLLACRSRPTREWRADDHDEEPGAAQPSTAVAQAPAQVDEALVESAWKVSCAECHGLSGRGDGPKAPMTHPPNLADPSYLASQSDEQIAAVIRGGRGKMPAFPGLTPNLVAGLVRRARALGGAK